MHTLLNLLKVGNEAHYNIEHLDMWWKNICTMFKIYAAVLCIFALSSSGYASKLDNKIDGTPEVETSPCPCTCGVFLTGQFEKGSKQPPRGNPALLQEMDHPFMNSAVGNRQCMNKCLELILKHLAKSSDIICAAVDRDCHKERAYLFIKNHSEDWVNTNLSAGREFCCKDNEAYKCPK